MRRATASVFSGLVFVADADDDDDDDAAADAAGAVDGEVDDADAVAVAADNDDDGRCGEGDDGGCADCDNVRGRDDLLGRWLRDEDCDAAVVLDLLGDGMSSGQRVVHRSFPPPPSPPPCCGPPRGIRGDTGVGGGACGKSAACSAVARSSVSISSPSDDERSSSHDSATCRGVETCPEGSTPPLLFEASGLTDKDNASMDFWTSLVS